MFQAMGHTMPSLIASGMRLVLFALPAIWLSSYPAFELWHLWYLSAVTVALQALASWWMLIKEFRRRLGVAPTAEPAAHGV